MIVNGQVVLNDEVKEEPALLENLIVCSGCGHTNEIEIIKLVSFIDSLGITNLSFYCNNCSTEWQEDALVLKHDS